MINLRFFGWGILLGLSVASAAAAAPFVPARDAHCVAFSPDGRTIAIGISGQSNSEFPPRPHPSPRKCGVVQIFDIASKKRLRRMETFGDLTQLAYSPDGSLLAAARLFLTDDGIELNEVRVWETATGNTRHAFDRCHSFAFAPQRPEITVVSHKRCVVYDRETGRRLRQIPPLADALRVAYLPLGDAVCGIVRGGGGYQLRCCDEQTGEVRQESPSLPEPFYSLAVPERGNQLATGHRQGVVLVWDLATWQPVGRLATGSVGRASPFLSRDGALIGAADQQNSDVVIWDWESGRELARYTFGQGSLRTYFPKLPLRTERPEEDPVRFAFSADGTLFLGGPYGGILRSITDGHEIARYE